MRTLFTFAGSSGHLDPLIPIARAAQAAGHVVAFAGRPWMIPRVEAAGFEGFASGSDQGGKPQGRLPLLPLDQEREDDQLRDGFARRIARERAADLLPIGERWRPDLIVWEETDFGAAAIAERLGLPHASLVVTAAGSMVRDDLVREPMDELRAALGLPPDPDLTMLRRHLVLSPFPPSLRDPDFPLPATGRSFRPPMPDPTAGDRAPQWLKAAAQRAPVVYFTLGTVFNVESGDLYARVIAGLRELPIELVVTVGEEIDPAELGWQPANVHIQRYIPQSLLLPSCSLVVPHGGSGSILGAIAHGLAMVIIPMGADQPKNAGRCEAVGAARVLDPIALTPASVRAAVAAVLADPSYRLAAERLRDELIDLPAPVDVVGWLEALVATAVVPEAPTLPQVGPPRPSIGDFADCLRTGQRAIPVSRTERARPARDRKGT